MCYDSLQETFVLTFDLCCCARRSADALLPVLEFAVVRTRMPELLTYVQIVDTFINLA